MKDETLTCQDCRGQFVFTIGEQMFFREKNFFDPPKRCPACRRAKKRARQQREASERPIATWPEKWELR